MKSLEYYKRNLISGILTLSALLIILTGLPETWFKVHIPITIIFLIVFFTGIIGLYKKKEWAPGAFLILYGFQAIDSFYIFSISRKPALIFYMTFSIVALFNCAQDADTLIKVKRFKTIKKHLKIRNNSKKSK